MYFKQFLHDDLGCSSYLIASRESRAGAVIDPHREVRQYVDLAADTSGWIEAGNPVEKDG